MKSLIIARIRLHTCLHARADACPTEACINCKEVYAGIYPQNEQYSKLKKCAVSCMYQSTYAFTRTKFTVYIYTHTHIYKHTCTCPNMRMHTLFSYQYGNTDVYTCKNTYISIYKQAAHTKTKPLLLAHIH